MSPFIAAFLAIIGALCLALSGYYTALCYATDYKTLNKLVLDNAHEPQTDKTPGGPSSQEPARTAPGATCAPPPLGE